MKPMPSTTSKRVLVPVADGSEELEAVAVIDLLRRAGAEVTVAAVGEQPVVTMSRGVTLVADALLDDVAQHNYDAVVLPGGMPGAERLRDSAVLTALLRRQAVGSGLLAAICAAPVVVLQHHGLLAGRRATCHPQFAAHLAGGAADDAVVVDGNLVTGRGPGTAVGFALALIARLYDTETAQAVAVPLALASEPANGSSAPDLEQR